MRSNGSMNRVYGVVWNATKGVWQAVPETAKGRGKTKPSKRQSIKRTASAFLLMPLSAFAAELPTGGEIVAGTGSISQSGSTMTVTQNTDRMAANWNSFSIGQGNTVNFVQPNASSVALNRVLGSDVSVIQGALNANGHVFLINPNGVLFSPTAQVNVGGLVASTLNLSTEDFMGGNYRFEGDSTASVKNQGSIKTGTGGTVALIAVRIENTGSITTPQGNVLMGAGRKVRLDLGGPVKIEVEEGALNSVIDQGGGIRSDGGLVYLTAKAAGDLTASVINHTGITEARSLSTNDKGEIFLMGDIDGGTVNVAGTLDTGAIEGAPAGTKGGFVETSAHNVKIADGTVVKGDSWLIDPTDFTIHDGTDSVAGSSMGASTLAANLNTASVKIATVAGGSEKGDIHVNSAVTWSADTKLTLAAHGNININADITATHADGKVQLEYDLGAVLGSTPANYNFNGGKINLKAGDNFATKRGSNGDVVQWKVITDLGSAADHVTAENFTLQGLGHNTNLNGKYVLGANIDASATFGWNASAGFLPIGTFSGSFDGLGHTINNLTINRPTTENVGLFGYTENATFRNIGLVGGSVYGNNAVGGLVGQLYANNNGTASIRTSYATANVTGEADTGGLVGRLFADDGTASISNSYASGDVTGTYHTGGLVGQLLAQRNAVASDNPTASIVNSYATGSVEGTEQVGGLVGLALGQYRDFHASGGSSIPTASVANSYATGSVKASKEQAGGLVGLALAQYQESHEGDNSGVRGSSAVSITNSYATGSVTGPNKIGGLLGMINAQGYMGGSDGAAASISNSFWNIESFAGNGVGEQGGTAIVSDTVRGKTMSEMQSISTYSSDGATWDIGYDYNYDGGYLYPRLSMKNGSPVWVMKGIPTEVSYTLSNLSNTYSGNKQMLGGDWSSLFIFGSAYNDWILGTDYTFQYGGNTVTSFTNANTYENIGVNVLKDGFFLSSAGNTAGKYVITPVSITVTANDLNKKYGQADPAFTYSINSGSLLGIDSLGNLTRAVGEDVGNYVIDSSALANGNYVITAINGVLTISPHPAPKPIVPDADVGGDNASKSAIFAVQQSASQAASSSFSSSPNQGSGSNVNGGLVFTEISDEADADGLDQGASQRAGRDLAGPSSIFVLNGGINLGDADTSTEIQ